MVDSQCPWECPEQWLEWSGWLAAVALPNRRDCVDFDIAAPKPRNQAALPPAATTIEGSNTTQSDQKGYDR